MAPENNADPDQMASDFFQDWWALVTHGTKNGGSFSEMMGPKHIILHTVDIWVVYFSFRYTDTDTCLQKISQCILTADYKGRTCLKRSLKKEDQNWFSRPIIALCRSKVLQNAPRGAFCNPFHLH